MTTIQQLATDLAAKNLSDIEIFRIISGCQPYATLAQINEAIDAALTA